MFIDATPSPFYGLHNLRMLEDIPQCPRYSSVLRTSFLWGPKCPNTILFYGVRNVRMKKRAFALSSILRAVSNLRPPRKLGFYLRLFYGVRNVRIGSRWRRCSPSSFPLFRPCRTIRRARLARYFPAFWSQSQRSPGSSRAPHRGQTL